MHISKTLTHTLRAVSFFYFIFFTDTLKITEEKMFYPEPGLMWLHKFTP